MAPPPGTIGRGPSNGFWSVVLTSALGETVDRASLAAARKVFRDGFLASRGASDLVLPRRPLGEIFDDRLGQWLADRGVEGASGNAPVRQIEGDADSGPMRWSWPTARGGVRRA